MVWKNIITLILADVSIIGKDKLSMYRFWKKNYFTYLNIIHW